MRCFTGCASGEPPSNSWTVSPATTDGLSTTVKVGVVVAVMLSVLKVPLSDPEPRLGVPPIGAAVSSVKLSEAVPVLPKASIWLATMVCAPSARPLGSNDHPR